jgi:glycosyltransferase involved in cell wall biosynthesis
LLVPPQDSAALAHAIERLLDDPALGRRLGQAAQAFAAKHCTETVTVETFRRQLIELASRR